MRYNIHTSSLRNVGLLSFDCMRRFYCERFTVSHKKFYCKFNINNIFLSIILLLRRSVANFSLKANFSFSSGMHFDAEAFWKEPINVASSHYHAFSQNS